MNFIKLLENNFSDVIRLKGSEYQSRGCVTIGDYDPFNYVMATVSQGGTHSVSLNFRPGRLDLACSCVHFQRESRCPHVWAVILEAEKKKLLQPGPGSESLTVLPAIPGIDRGDHKDAGAAHGRKAGLSLEMILAMLARNSGRTIGTGTPAVQDWKTIIQQMTGDEIKPRPGEWPADRELIYCISPNGNTGIEGLSLDVMYRQKKKKHGWSVPRTFRLDRRQIERLPVAADVNIMTILAGGNDLFFAYGHNQYRLPRSLAAVILPMVCATGRCCLGEFRNETPLPVLGFEHDPPWVLRLHVERHSNNKDYIITGRLERGEESQSLSAPLLITNSGWIFWKTYVARLDNAGAFNWIRLLREKESITVPEKEAGDIPVVLAGKGFMPRIKLPKEIQYDEMDGVPAPKLLIKKSQYRTYPPDTLEATVAYEYGEHEVSPELFASAICNKDKRVLIRRDVTAEQNAVKHLDALGLKRSSYHGLSAWRWEIKPKELSQLVMTLSSSGWKVQAEGRIFRSSGAFNVEVKSGIDWFELSGRMDFDGVSAELPALLKAIRNKDHFITLDDGSVGILPEQWMKKYGTITALGQEKGDHVVFKRHQAGLLDALIAAQPDVKCDETFLRVRDELKSFESIKPAPAPKYFSGTLRDYQAEGLGWLHFLRRFGFGGCLADDMGLGKTVQVLALLEARRMQRKARSKAKDPDAPVGPSLVVVPRSLVFNWTQEAQRFTPELRILDHTHPERERETPDFADYDIILVTYGIMTRDITLLKDMHFDYVILDEAQAIKNAAAQASKASRLLNARHRLAMSGTPVQNHLGELWSLFEFLNPGMLGTASVFNLTEVGSRNPQDDTRELLARALRPFILRRTKGQVARELPERTEETLFCEMDKNQRKLYNELRDHYKAVLLDKIETDGLNKAKIVVLEALLRLRQAACHPGLIDKKRLNEPCAKLDALIPQLTEVIEEGHKAIVFSQFTSFLAIVQDHLKERNIQYEYLDGQTRDRQAPVERFQKDENCKLFLISLKAGGLGLNLTSAEYVFLLDPWWNPAIEAQAIDRAHRIGQTCKVFAYRLIATDTVEEKVLELQKTKKQLADSIINADNSLIRNLTREDLQLLLA